MEVTAKFTSWYDGKEKVVELDTECNLIQDGWGESFGYWVVTIDGHYYEVNIWADEDGNLLHEGHADCFSDYEHFKSGDASDGDVQVRFEF